MSTEPTYTYRQLAARVEEVLGARPSLSSLRAAGAETRRTRSVRRRPRLTVGMPAPQPSSSPTAPALFSQAEVEHWLAHHPRAGFLAPYRALVAAAAGPAQDLDAAVGRARRDGLSWQHVAEALSEGSGITRSRSWAHLHYQHVTDRV
ncbi:MAG: hypothetical protein ACOYBY_16125 [Dermatophilaceae bacterium]